MPLITEIGLCGEVSFEGTWNITAFRQTQSFLSWKKKKKKSSACHVRQTWFSSQLFGKYFRICICLFTFQQKGSCSAHSLQVGRLKLEREFVIRNDGFACPVQILRPAASFSQTQFCMLGAYSSTNCLRGCRTEVELCDCLKISGCYRHLGNLLEHLGARYVWRQLLCWSFFIVWCIATTLRKDYWRS